MGAMMEYMLGYLMGVGADWPTIVVCVVGALIIGVVAKALFGDHS
jgi:fluoride ion exporter CrcB/FEX